MDVPNSEPDTAKPRPDYPPKTPPPPKRPPSPPPPDPPRSHHRLLEGLPVPQHSGHAGIPVMKNRRGMAWAMEAQPWTGKKAVRHVAGKLGEWGIKMPASLDEVVSVLVSTVIADGGRRISVHLSEQDHRILILAISHHASPGALDEHVLPTLRDLGATSCGTELTGNGRQLWALLNLAS